MKGTATPDAGRIRLEIPTPQGAPIELVDTTTGTEIFPNGPTEVLIGLRPEAMTDQKLNNGLHLQAANCLLEVVEPAGADTYAVVQLGGAEAIARLSADTPVQAGEMSPITFDLSKISYFDISSGNRL
jgi:multiple sugar transport system ATP-binding protein